MAALDTMVDRLPESPEDFVRRCRDTSEIAAIATALRVDLGRLNVVIAALGSPYSAIDLTSRHQTTLSTFLGRKEGAIRESIRESFRPVFNAGGSLNNYVAARDAPRPELPAEYGLRHVELTNAEMRAWLDQWMADFRVQAHCEPASPRDHRDAIRDANLKLLRASIPEFRIAVLARAPENDSLRALFAKLPELEAAAVNAALSGGWVDFDRLDQNRIAYWLARSGLWPSDWSSLASLAITHEERAARAQQDESARMAATTAKRQLAYSGGVFTFGVDTMGSLADHIAGLVAGNAALLKTSARTVKGTAPEIRPSSGGGGGGGGGGGTRRSDDERNLIGFFGEAIAFEWLKSKYGTNRVVDESCWKSMYRKQVFGGDGNDSLGYDFEIVNGATHWYFEVKATTVPGPLQVQSLELGASEFRSAEACKADRRERYRILYITDALNPDKASIFPLPNPRSRQGLSFYTDTHAGRRLYFPLH
jgi:hypothetical protein